MLENQKSEKENEKIYTVGKIGTFRANNQLFEQTSKILKVEIEKHQNIQKRFSEKTEIGKKKYEILKENCKKLNKKIDQENLFLEKEKENEEIIGFELKKEEGVLCNLEFENSKLKNECEYLNENELFNNDSDLGELLKQETSSDQLFKDLKFKLAEIKKQNLISDTDNFQIKKEICDLLAVEKDKSLNLAERNQEIRHFSELANEFSELKFKYLEKINERVLEKNSFIRKIREENQRIDDLTFDIDKSLKGFSLN